MNNMRRIKQVKACKVLSCTLSFSFSGISLLESADLSLPADCQQNLKTSKLVH